jgi:hypothetical protein
MATEILRPDGDLTCSLSRSAGSYNYACVDESTLDTGDYVYKTSNANGTPVTASDLYSCGTYTKGSTISKVIGWFYLGSYLSSYGNGSVSFTLKLYKGSTELASATVTGTGWQSVTYTGDLTQSEIDDLRLYVYMSVTDGYYWNGKSYAYYASTGYCYMAYAEVCPSQTLTPSSFSSGLAFGTALITLNLTPSGVASGLIFGSHSIDAGLSISPSCIASALTFGSPALNLTLNPSSVAPTSACGLPQVNFTLYPSSCDLSTVFGTPGISIIGRIAPSGISPIAAFGAPVLTLHIQVIEPASITPTLAVGSPWLDLFIIPSGLPSSGAFGIPAVSKNILSSGIAGDPVFGSPSLTVDIQPSPRVPALAFGVPAFYQGNINARGISSSLAFGSTVLIVYLPHVILEASYFEESPDVNYVFVIGEDSTGSQVTGSAEDTAESSLVGSRLDVTHDSSIPSSASAASVASAALSHARLSKKRARITIPPHCGLVLWDVVSIYDSVSNQNCLYRVIAYQLEYDIKKANHQNILVLSAP